MSRKLYRLRSTNIPNIKRLATVFFLMTGCLSVSDPVNAQPGYPACQPPGSGESLLLVVTNTDETQQQVLGILPPQVTPSVCNYLDDIVLRVEGFPSINAASNWAEYIQTNLGLSAFVAVPQGESAVPQAAPATVIPDPYNPQPLGQGYAILVDYFNNPQVAAELQQILRSNIGLVSYQQRPYLLAEFTSNQNTAKKVLQTLSDRGFWVFMVNAPQVILLRSQVAVTL
jgi:hypothetical protein